MSRFFHNEMLKACRPITTQIVVPGSIKCGKSVTNWVVNYDTNTLLVRTLYERLLVISRSHYANLYVIEAYAGVSGNCLSMNDKQVIHKFNTISDVSTRHKLSWYPLPGGGGQVNWTKWGWFQRVNNSVTYRPNHVFPTTKRKFIIMLKPCLSPRWLNID